MKEEILHPIYELRRKLPEEEEDMTAEEKELYKKYNKQMMQVCNTIQNPMGISAIRDLDKLKF